jgi:hypothetical protein
MRREKEPREPIGVNVNTTDATTGATALLLPACDFLVFIANNDRKFSVPVANMYTCTPQGPRNLVVVELDDARRVGRVARAEEPWVVER